MLSTSVVIDLQQFFIFILRSKTKSLLPFKGAGGYFRGATLFGRFLR
jgi:hypothetical protein